MKRKWCIGVLIMLLLTLCGCQLAVEELDDSSSGKDRLIGVFVTLEHLDLFDDEAYIEDNLNAILAGKDISGVDSLQYSGRLYAILKDRLLTNEETGEKVTTQEYVFESVKGFSYMVPMMQDADGVYVGTGSDEAISNGHTAIKHGDTEEYSLTGTIYLDPVYGDAVCYLNPVYQSADGCVYAVQGSGYSMNGAMAEGSVFTATLSEETTVTTGSEKKATKTSVSIVMEVMFAPEEIVITELDADDAVVRRTAYIPGETPKTYAPSPETACLMIHTLKHDRNGKEVRSSQLCDRLDDGFDTFFRRDDGVCVERYTKLEWNS